MTNYESGKFIAQKFSHDITRLLKAIYMGTVEPHKPLNDFEKGVRDEVKMWGNLLSQDGWAWLNRLDAGGLK